MTDCNGLYASCCAPVWKAPSDDTLFAYVAHVPGTGVALVWPLVLYNLSGLAAGRAARRFSVAAADVWLVHDDIDLPVGAVRHAAATKSGGGNRGVLSSGLFLVCRSTCL